MASKENTDDTEYSDKNDKDIEVCRDFLNKCCSFGALCKYQHPESDTSSKSRKRARSQSPMSKAEGSNSATCRDFLRNMCTRGKNCRFYHPPEEEVNKKSWFTLCLDFQNGGCSRYDCRYFHLSTKDEDLFRETGEVSNHLVDQAMQKAPNLDVAIKSRPTCKDYLKGYCKFKSCRFRHVTRREFEEEIYKALKDELYELIGDDKLAAKHSFHNETDYRPYSNYPDKTPMSYGTTPIHENPSYMENRGEERMGIPNSYTEYSLGTPPFLPRKGGSSQFEEGPRDFGQPQDSYYSTMKNNTSANDSPFDRKPNDFRGSGPLFPSAGFSTDTIGSFGDRPTQNDPVAQLQLENERLRKKIDDMMGHFNSSTDTKNMQYGIKEKPHAVQNENSEYVEKIKKLNEEINALKNDVQSWKKYETYILEQGRSLQNHLTLVENELSQSWGGGPPPLPSQREAWSQLRSILMRIITPNFEKSSAKLRSTGNNNSGSGPPLPDESPSRAPAAPSSSYPHGLVMYNHLIQSTPQNARGRMEGPPGW